MSICARAACIGPKMNEKDRNRSPGPHNCLYNKAMSKINKIGEFREPVAVLLKRYRFFNETYSSPEKVRSLMQMENSAFYAIRCLSMMPDSIVDACIAGRISLETVARAIYPLRDNKNIYPIIDRHLTNNSRLTMRDAKLLLWWKPASRKEARVASA